MVIDDQCYLGEVTRGQINIIPNQFSSFSTRLMLHMLFKVGNAPLMHSHVEGDQFLINDVISGSVLWSQKHLKA